MSDSKTREREIRGLVEAMEQHSLKKALILTYDEKENIQIDDKHIEIMPVWKWLLT